MQDPVMDPEGNTYERSAIQQWLQTHHTSPITRTPLEFDALVPNRNLRDAIAAVTFDTTTAPVSPSASPPLPSLPDVHIPLTLTTTMGPHSEDVQQVHVSIQAPDVQRVPCDVVLVVDESGSMGTRTSVSNQDGAPESDGLTVMDIVKHGARTVVHALGTHDRVAIVGFTDTARVVMGFVSTTPEGKEEATQRVHGIHPKRTTNLWDGLHTALQMIAERDDTRRHPTVILLTDGVPNICPPRGELAMLRKYKDQHCAGTLPAVQMFGFGYEMESTLLAEMATESHGLFTFIPDAGMVGTAFVHAVANLRIACATEAHLKVEFDDGTLDDVCLPSTRTSWGADISVGAVYQGQARDVVLAFRGLSHPPSVSLVYTEVNGKTATTEATILERSLDTSEDLAAQFYRQQVVTALGIMTTGDPEVRELHEMAEALQSQLRRASESLPHHTYVQALHQEVSDQVTKAVSRNDWYRRWGRHYLRAVRGAHMYQQCTNFKDPGQQHYGGALFKDGRDDADEVFLRLPAPTPSATPSATTRGFSRGTGGHRGGHSPVYRSLTQPVDMSRYHNAGGACFAGDSLVTRADGTTVRVDTVRQGHQLMDANGEWATVRCVLETRLPGGTVLTTLPTGLRLTPWHPVRVQGTWTFPCEVDGSTTTQDRCCQSVYSLLVEREDQWSDTVLVNGTVCITLAHGRTDSPVLTHAFYGTDAVARELQGRAGWTRGWVSVVGARVPRGPDGNVCGLPPDDGEADADNGVDAACDLDATSDEASEDEGLESGEFLVHGGCPYAALPGASSRSA